MEMVAWLRMLLAKATPGPWRGWSGGIFGGPNDDRVDDFGNGENNRANRALIVDAMNALPSLPSLLDRLEAAEAVVEAARDVDRRRQDHGRDAGAETALHDAIRRYDEVRCG